MESSISAAELDDVQRDMKNLAGGALVNLVGKLGRLSRGLFFWVIALLCGAELLGLYTLAWSIVYTLGRIGRFGLHRGVSRFVVEARAAGDEERAERAIAAALLLALAAGMATAGLIVLGAGPIVPIFYDNPDLVPALRIMAWCIPLLTFMTVFIEATRALRIMRFGVYVLSIAGPLLLLAGGLITGLLGLGLFGLAVTQLLTALGMCLLAGFYFRRYFSLWGCLRRLRDELPWRSLARFCSPVMLTDLLYAVLLRLDVFMLGAYITAGGIGVYSMARRVSSVLLKVPQSFDPVFSPIVSDLSYQGKHQQLGARFASIARWILTISLALFGGILIAGEKILGLFGAEYAVATSSLIVLGLGMTIHGVFALAEPILIMTGRPLLNLINNVFWLASSFLLNLALIPRYGILGAAVGAALSMGLVNGIRLVELYLIHGIHPFHRSQLKPLFAALVAFGGSWMLRDALLPDTLLAVAALLVIFLGIYLLLLFALGIEAEDRVLLERIRKRRRRK